MYIKCKNSFKGDLEMRIEKVFVINETTGFFLGNEEELCKEYCEINGYTYRIEYWKFPN